MVFAVASVVLLGAALVGPRASRPWRIALAQPFLVADELLEYFSADLSTLLAAGLWREDRRGLRGAEVP